MYNNIQTAQKIKVACKEKGYTIKEVLNSCQINQNLLQEMRRQDTTSIDNIYKIAEFLDVSIDYLVNRTENSDVNI